MLQKTAVGAEFFEGARILTTADPLPSAIVMRGVGATEVSNLMHLRASIDFTNAG
jgi:hypothetical protein